MLLGFGIGGCHVRPPTSPDSDVLLSVPVRRAETYQGSFLRAEWSILHALARTDRRILARMPLLRNEQVMLRHFADPYLFTDRERTLAEALDDFERCKLEESAWDPRLHDQVVEQGLFARMLAEENARLEWERTSTLPLPALLRELATMASLDPAPPPAHDGIVAWRLDELGARLEPNTFSELQRADSVAPLRDLERARGWPRTARAAQRVRSQVEALIAAPLELVDYEDLEPMVTLHLGTSLRAAELQRLLVEGREVLGAQLDAGLDVLSPATRKEVLARAAERVLVPAQPCGRIVRGSVMRSLAPPPERALACDGARLLAEANEDVAELTALAVLYDRASLALWAISLHGSDRSASTAARWELRSPVRSEAALAALAQDPLDFLVAGASAAALASAGGGKLRERATAWTAFGNAPLDFVAREAWNELGPFGRAADMSRAQRRED